MKFLEQDLKAGATHDVPEQIIVEHVKRIFGQIAMNTTTSHRLVTKA